jgi:hypothetical protein
MVAVIASFRWLGGKADFEVVRLGDSGSQMVQGLVVRGSFHETVTRRDRKRLPPEVETVGPASARWLHRRVLRGV